MEIVDVTKYDVSPSDSLFFDTNVWLYIYGPVAGVNKNKQTVYSRLLKEAISRGATIFISSLIVSEYVNRVLRMGFKQWEKANNFSGKDYKRDFRSTQEYKNQLDEAKQEINDIFKIKQVEKRSDDFHSADIYKLINSMDDKCDFNDAYFINLCESNGIKLVSDDADISKLPNKIKLLTITRAC